jgi:hypothetical protein
MFQIKSNVVDDDKQFIKYLLKFISDLDKPFHNENITKKDITKKDITKKDITKKDITKNDNKK